MVPGATASLAVIRWVVSRLSVAAGLSPTAVDQVEMAVDEACTNVLDHAYADSDPKPPLHVIIENTPDALIFDIIDQGKTFDYPSYQEPKFPAHWLEGNERGVGLYLIHRLMDKVEYENIPHAGNRMRLTKYHAGNTANPAPMQLSEVS